MLHVGDKFDNPRTGASFEVLRTPTESDGALEVRRVLVPGTGKTLAHAHHDYLERFSVEAGEATAKLDGRTLKLRAGDELTIPVGERHVNAYNSGAEPLVMRHLFEPVSDFALGYVETLGQMMRDGRADRQGELPLLAVFAIAHETDSQTFAAGIPHAVQRSVLAPMGARLAPMRGYELSLPGVD